MTHTLIAREVPVYESPSGWAAFLQIAATKMLQISMKLQGKKNPIKRIGGEMEQRLHWKHHIRRQPFCLQSDLSYSLLISGGACSDGEDLEQGLRIGVILSAFKVKKNAHNLFQFLSFK